MADIIQLLPESIANQIAAGEVIQRPASVVKELLENAIDAGSTSITVVIKHSGKSLIQVIDNGVGMSETDARMSFERHATSKIRETEDLFSIKTMGFRGEALASIASISEVELKTKLHGEELGTHLRIKTSDVISQEYCQTEPGTSLAVKNLFFNVPARRKFLKSDPVEFRHILEEFKRIALAHCEIRFSLVHNGEEIYNLVPGQLKRRILSLFKKSYETGLLTIKEETDHLKIEGFVGNEELFRKQKGDQYLFVNKRYIKSPYLNHAIKMGFGPLLGDEHYPFYVIFLEIDPSRIDINVHPTKQEIKFEDERLIYNYLKVTVKHALGRYNLAPALDFESDKIFSARGHTGMGPGFSQQSRKDTSAEWQSLYQDLNRDTLDLEFSKEDQLVIPSAATGDILGSTLYDDNEEKKPMQIHSAYILLVIKSGFILIDQQHAHERILYERFIHALESSEAVTQSQLFPVTIKVEKANQQLFEGIMPSMKRLGYEIQSFGGDTYIVQGIPSGFDESNMQEIIDTMLAQYRQNIEVRSGNNEALAQSMAKSASLKKNRKLSIEEMRSLIDELFACETPFITPGGKKCFITFELKDIVKDFQ